MWENKLHSQEEEKNEAIITHSKKSLKHFSGVSDKSANDLWVFALHSFFPKGARGSHKLIAKHIWLIEEIQANHIYELMSIDTQSSSRAQSRANLAGMERAIKLHFYIAIPTVN